MQIRCRNRLLGESYWQAIAAPVVLSAGGFRSVCILSRWFSWSSWFRSHLGRQARAPHDCPTAHIGKNRPSLLVVRRNIHVQLNQAQFDALCSLSYNAGAKGSFTTFNLVNKGDFAGAAANMALMIKVQVVEKGKKKYVIAPGLIKRRAEESAPFLVKDASTAASK